MTHEALRHSSSSCLIFFIHCDPVRLLFFQFLKQAKVFPTSPTLHMISSPWNTRFLTLHEVASSHHFLHVISSENPPYYPTKSGHCPSQFLVYFLHGAYQNSAFLFVCLNESALCLFLPEVWGQGCAHYSVSSVQHIAWHKSDVHYTLNKCAAY